MKFISSVVSLALVSSGAAFTVPTPVRQSSALNSFSYNPSDDGVGQNPQGPNLTPGAGASLTRSDGGGSIAKNSGKQTADMQLSKDIWDTLSPTTVQGGSLRTWVTSPSTERVQVLMKSDGRPVNANVELWAGPDNTPEKMAVYIEDGNLRPFSAVIETPRGNNAIAIRNTGHLEFPLSACVEPDMADASGNGSGLAAVIDRLNDMSIPKIIQGGSIKTVPFATNVQSVQVLLKTDGRPLNARIELLQGPNNNKQVLEVYTEDGLERPFFAVVETPGTGNVVRVVNTATVEFPLSASIEPYLVEDKLDFGSDDYIRENMNGGTESASKFFFLEN